MLPAEPEKTTSPAQSAFLRGFPRVLGSIGVLGIVVVPMLIVVAVNSWQPPDAHAYVRMAFGQVAGQTVAVATALTLVVVSVRKGSGALALVMASVAVLVIATSIVSVQSTAAWLLGALG